MFAQATIGKWCVRRSTGSATRTCVSNMWLAASTSSSRFHSYFSGLSFHWAREPAQVPAHDGRHVRAPDSRPEGGECGECAERRRPVARRRRRVHQTHRAALLESAVARRALTASASLCLTAACCSARAHCCFFCTLSSALIV